jgi:uncharacterized oxidoreductase
MLSIYVSVDRLDAEAAFAGEVETYLAYFRDTAPATADGKVLVPGDPERLSRAARMRDGVPLADEAWKSICDTADRLGVAAPAIG